MRGLASTEQRRPVVDQSDLRSAPATLEASLTMLDGCSRESPAIEKVAAVVRRAGERQAAERRLPKEIVADKEFPPENWGI